MDESRLKQFPLFEGLDDDGLHAIARAVQEVSVGEGATLVREGDYSYDLTLIDEGQAKVTHEGGVVATLGPGDVFGEAGVLGKALRNATVESTTPMRLVTLTAWDLRRLRNRVPALNERLERLAKVHIPTQGG